MYSSWVMNSSCTSFMFFSSPLIVFAYRRSQSLRYSFLLMASLLVYNSKWFSQERGTECVWTAIRYLLSSVIKKKKFWSGYQQDIMSLSSMNMCYMIPALKSSVLLGQHSNIAQGLCWCSSQAQEAYCVFMLFDLCLSVSSCIKQQNQLDFDNKPRWVLSNKLTSWSQSMEKPLQLQ